jgi:hypothetical protein
VEVGSWSDPFAPFKKLIVVHGWRHNFSKRPLRIRGSVMFPMRDGGSVDFCKDMLPINYRTDTTKFCDDQIYAGTVKYDTGAVIYVSN